jgi:hypothetical protein
MDHGMKDDLNGEVSANEPTPMVSHLRVIQGKRRGSKYG